MFLRRRKILGWLFSDPRVPSVYLDESLPNSLHIFFQRYTLRGYSHGVFESNSLFVGCVVLSATFMLFTAVCKCGRKDRLSLSAPAIGRPRDASDWAIDQR